MYIVIKTMILIALWPHHSGGLLSNSILLMGMLNRLQLIELNTLHISVTTSYQELIKFKVRRVVLLT